MEMFDYVQAAYRADGKLFGAHCDLLYPCDLDCEHCYLDDKVRPQKPTAFWKDVFDQVASLQVVALELSGGEIFLRKDLFELIEHARSQGLYVILKTHGGHITREKATRLAELGVSVIDVSYYSHRPEVHDAITRDPGSHARTLAGLRYLVEAGLRVKVNIMAMKRNIDDIRGVVEQCRDLGLAYDVSSDVHSALSGSSQPLSTAVSQEQGVALGGLLQELLDPCSIDPSTVPWAEQRICGAGNDFLYIDPEGWVMPCSFWPIRLGQLGPEQRLADLIDTSTVLDQVRARRNGDRHGCGSCAGKDACGFCPGQAWHESRDSMAPAAVTCTDTYSRVVARARAIGEPDPPKPPGLRTTPFQILRSEQAGCHG